MDSVRLFLSGDVMTGRGIDQALPHPSGPQLHEPWVRDARDYVRLAEAANGPIPKPVDFDYIWGDALPELEARRPDVRIINLETSVTRSDEFAPGKEVHYRMSPDNIGCVATARPDVCVLANNHVLDFGRGGLAETLATLDRHGLAHAGAGRSAKEARAPTLTIERLDELAALAATVSGDAGRRGPEVTRRVLGVAQWLLGRR